MEMDSENPFDKLCLTKMVVEEAYRVGYLTQFLRKYKFATAQTFHPDRTKKESLIYSNIIGALGDIENANNITVKKWIESMNDGGGTHGELEELVAALSSDVEYRITVEAQLQKKITEYETLVKQYSGLQEKRKKRYR